MPSRTAKQTDLAQVLLNSVLKGSYPESEDVASADLTTAALRPAVESLKRAREDVKDEIRKVSRENGQEIDSWISQARQLHADIEASKTKADEILVLAEEEKALRRAVADAANKYSLLRSEIRFNASLSSVLGRLQIIGATLSQFEDAVRKGEFGHAVGILDSAEVALKKMVEFAGTIVVGLMKEKAKGLRGMLLDTVDTAWGEIVKIDKEGGAITVKKDAAVPSGQVSGEAVVEALKILNLLKPNVDQLHQKIDTLLIHPRLDPKVKEVPTFSVSGDTLRISDRSTNLTAAAMFLDLRLIITFLNDRLPPTIISSLSPIFITSLTTRLISSSLASSVPSSLENLPAFETLLEETKNFETYLEDIKWTREQELQDWVDRAPRVWLAKRRETSLDALRKTLAQGIGKVEVVERTETQTVKVKDREAGPEDGQGLDSEWKDKNEITKSPMEVKSSLLDAEFTDEDVSGWGLDDDIEFEDQEVDNGKTKENEQGVDDMDWGDWGDDDDPKKKDDPTKPKPRRTKSRRSTIGSKSQASKDVTLRETYTVTSIPGKIIELVQQIIHEANELSTNPEYSSSPIVSAASGLLALPTLILTAYRALAPIYYSFDLASNIYLYNDSVRLSALLKEIPTKRFSKSSSLEKDSIQIEVFGKRTYSKEMESQRVILTDYLDSAQSFVSCTSRPQSTTCKTAIKSCAARLRELHASWSKVLSKSALYQSTGSLLNTVVTRLIHDILDISDISEPESEALVGFCEEIARLEELFEGRPGGPPVAAVYCSAWLKFRFLEQILGGSMADIMYLYREGMLQEFSGEELGELVKALFADTDGRRGVLDEIRRGR